MSTVKYPVKKKQWDIIFFRKCTSMISETAECQTDFPNNSYQSGRNIEVAETHYLSDRLISMKYTFSGFAFQSTHMWFIWCHVIFNMRKQFKHVKCQKKALGDLRFLFFSKKKITFTLEEKWVTNPPHPPHSRFLPLQPALLMTPSCLSVCFGVVCLFEGRRQK